MKDKNGVEIVEDENSNQLSNENLVAQTVAGVLSGLKEQNNESNDSPANEPDPFDFTAIDQEINNQNENVNINDQNINNQNNQNTNDQNNQNNQPMQDSRFGELLTRVDANEQNVETNRRMTSMNNFIMEFNNEVKGVPELEIHRNEAIEEAKKSIGSGGYIPASDMLAYLDGKASIAKRKNTEVNNNPNISGDNQLNSSGDEKPFDLDEATADEIQEEYKNVVF